MNRKVLEAEGRLELRKKLRRLNEIRGPQAAVLSVGGSMRRRGLELCLSSIPTCVLSDSGMMGPCTPGVVV